MSPSLVLWTFSPNIGPLFIPRFVTFTFWPQLRFLPVYSALVTHFSHPLGARPLCTFICLNVRLLLLCSNPHLGCPLPWGCHHHCSIVATNAGLSLPLALWVLIFQRGPWIVMMILCSSTLSFTAMCILPGWLHQGWLPYWFCDQDSSFHPQAPLIDLANSVTIRKQLFLFF